MLSSRKRWIRAATVAGASALLLAACGGGSSSSDKSSSSTSSANAAPVTLKIASWGEFGFKEMQAPYKQVAPNVTLQLATGDYNAVNQDLQKYLIAGSGAADIQAIDEGFIVQYRNEPQYFVDLSKQEGGADREKDYISWKWNLAKATDGTVIGLGTDVGGQAMCYRTDLFKAAGLPTDRAAVGALWPTWADFAKVGQQYVATTKKKFIDNAVNVFNPILSQQPVGFFDTSENLQMNGGPKVAWDTTLPMITGGLSANLAAYSTQWDSGFKSGTFAVLACPAWMIGHIKTAAPETSGKWDIASIPGGGGNWGGSWLAIPKQSQHQAEAWKFINWFTQPAQMLEVFKKIGNLPSVTAVYQDPAFQNFTDPFFSNAPTGQIFTKAAEALKPPYLGKRNGVVRTAVENVIQAIQDGKVKPADGWAKAVKDATTAAKG